jgi:hypothetical protein
MSLFSLKTVKRSVFASGTAKDAEISVKKPPLRGISTKTGKMHSNRTDTANAVEKTDFRGKGLEDWIF